MKIKKSIVLFFALSILTGLAFADQDVGPISKSADATYFDTLQKWFDNGIQFTETKDLDGVWVGRLFFFNNQDKVFGTALEAGKSASNDPGPGFPGPRKRFAMTMTNLSAPSFNYDRWSAMQLHQAIQQVLLERSKSGESLSPLAFHENNTLGFYVKNRIWNGHQWENVNIFEILFRMHYDPNNQRTYIVEKAVALKALRLFDGSIIKPGQVVEMNYFFLKK